MREIKCGEASPALLVSAREAPTVTALLDGAGIPVNLRSLDTDSVLLTQEEEQGALGADFGAAAPGYLPLTWTATKVISSAGGLLPLQLSAAVRA